VFIAVDAMLKQARVESEVNVMEFCQKMRKSRTMMVRTVKQYAFIYDVIMEALLINYSTVGTDLKDMYRLLSEENPVTKRSHLTDQSDVLEKHVPGLTADKCSAGLKKENASRNRFNCLDLLPPDARRPVLKSPLASGRTDYINALYIDSYTQQRAFILTQSPLISTLVDFWQMVYDNNVSTIVMLDGQSLRDDTCARYWPSGDPADHNYGQFNVTLESEEQHDLVIIRSFRLRCVDSGVDREIYQLQCEAWAPGNLVPSSREAIIELLELAEGSQAEHDGSSSPPIVVHCMDGATRCGLFSVCFTIAETMRIEKQVDIFHTIKRLKTVRPKAIPNLVSRVL
jgi:protein tyrosine phosphatase